MLGFDYTQQEWHSGREGALLRYEQTLQELALLEGPKAKEYMAFIGLAPTFQDGYLATMRTQKLQLERDWGFSQQGVA